MPLTPVIAGQGWGVYRAAMSRLINILIVIALALMPLGMAAPAAAAAHHPAAASGAAEHCPDRNAAPLANNGIGECAMGCAAAIPPFDRIAGPPSPPATPELRVFVEPLTGLHPETATPPPRSS